MTGLRYSDDSKPGIQRRRKRGGFIYLDTSGKPIKESATLDRIRHLAIPPAWEKVWICPAENGHIQAAGRDARNRKQYRYHARWREQRDGNKFSRLTAFAAALPRIRTVVRRDLSRPGMPREKILAALVRLLETTLIRVGNSEYARTNHSYGLTTMHNGHARVRGAQIRFNFCGKSGLRHDIGMEDRRLATIVRKCQEIPGQELFSYLDDEGQPHDVSSHDVNDYLRSITGAEFTAKDFRTWAGTVLTAVALCETETAESQTLAKKNLVSVIQSVACVLRNTPAVCRRSYIHPAVLDSCHDAETLDLARQRFNKTQGNRRLKAAEHAALLILKRRLARAKRK